ncbi:MAG: acyl--CoA ligase [Betaproteobacteria bacterium]|nr:acyl--CoA ligase [Betaproteobacteria bacterium]
MKNRIPYQSLDQLISRHNLERGGKAYVISAETGAQITYSQLDAVTNRIGRFLASRSIKANDRVSVLSDNCLSQVALFQGVQRYGATVTLVNCEVHAKNVEQIVYDLEPKIVLWHRDLAPELQAIAKSQGVENHSFGDLPEAGPENEFFSLIANLPATHCDASVGGPQDFALINYTSGTTSSPKGVCCTHECYFYDSDSVATGFDIGENDRLLEYRALTWASPQQFSMTSTLQVGASFVLAKKFSVSNFFDWIRRYRVTISAGVPTAITMLLERPHAVTKADLPTLRYMTTSSAPIAPETYDAFEKRYGITLVQACGMSEGGFMFANDPKAPRRGPVGKPLRNLIARFVDEEGNDVPIGIDGELLIDGPQVFSAYLVARGQIQPRPARGLLTGDLGHFDENGYVFLTGRKKDLIIRGGVNIAPAEITSILCEHPEVLDAATIGVPDSIYGEAVACFVVPKPGKTLTVESIIEHLKPRLSEFKMPQSVNFMKTIPKTDRGKVSKDLMLKYWKESIQLKEKAKAGN